jgi:hypothetical protein
LPLFLKFHQEFDRRIRVGICGKKVRLKKIENAEVGYSKFLNESSESFAI